MGRFRSAQSQARHAIQKKLAIGKPSHGKAGEDGLVHGLGTARTHTDSLKGVASFISEQRLDPTGKGLGGLTSQIAQVYLECRAQEVGQKQLDKDRQAMQMVLGIPLPVIKSELDQVLTSRAYTHQQIELIATAQTPKHGTATRIASDAGLRAHELLTLLPIEKRLPSAHRVWSENLFQGRGEVKRYTVVGKGGLIREVGIAIDLADQLQALLLDEPLKISDRGIYHEQHYGIGGGKRWSDSFSKAAQRVLGWTEGAHGVRHTYAQTRMKVLQSMGLSFVAALEVVSQEMGHFRKEITEVYLR